MCFVQWTCTTYQGVEKPLESSLPTAFKGTGLTIPVKFQKQSQWCWAACSAMILEYYGALANQCDIANYALGQEKCCEDGGGSECNRINTLISRPPSYPKGINSILSHFGGTRSTFYDSVLTLQECKAQLSNGTPFIISWSYCLSDRYHFIVVYGVSDDNIVHFIDPASGKGQRKLPYDKVVKQFLNHQWVATLLTQPSPGSVAANPDNGD
jgi:hypothetical protein